MRSRNRMWIGPAAAVGVLIAAQVFAQAPASAAAALPLTGLQRSAGSSALNTSNAVQTAVAPCPAGKQVVGGGGRVVDDDGNGITTNRLTLTQVEPAYSVPTPAGQREGYFVTAAETVPGIATAWHVEAWALYANPIPGRADLPRVHAPIVTAASAGQASGVPSRSGGARIGSADQQPDQPLDRAAGRTPDRPPISTG